MTPAMRQPSPNAKLRATLPRRLIALPRQTFESGCALATRPHIERYMNMLKTLLLLSAVRALVMTGCTALQGPY